MSDIKQYIKRGGRKVGVICAGITGNEGTVGLGWSLCSGNHGDDFDIYKCNDIAYGRLNTNYKNQYFTGDVPLSILSEIKPFLIRMKTYYKQNNFSDFVDDLFCEFELEVFEVLDEV